MKQDEVKKLADEIFDAIERNYPRGIIKDQIIDILSRYTEQPAPRAEEYVWRFQTSRSMIELENSINGVDND
jgi:hypothetical protein